MNKDLKDSISDLFNKQNIQDLNQLRNFAFSMFNYLKDKFLLDDYSNWKLKGIKNGNIK